MKIYLDVVFLINSLYDALILISVSVLLKRHTQLKRILLGVLVGTISLITLFVSFDKFFLLLFKFVISVIMVLVTFGKKRVLENLFYFYIITVIIGGSQYMLTGNYYEVNILTFGLISPVIIYLYLRSMKEYRLSINKYYDVIIVSGNDTIKLRGLMDTGNTLIEPIFRRPVLMINKKYNIKFNKEFLVPIKVVNNESIISCGQVDKIIIDNKIVDCLLGVVDNNVFKRGVDIILNECIREELYD